MFERLFGPGPQSTLIEAAFRDVSSMLLQSVRMLDHAAATLLENKPLDVDLDVMDDPVDESERMVRRTILEHLSLNPQRDLVASLILASIVQDAERIGDCPRRLGVLASLAQGPREGLFRDDLKKILDQLRPLFTTCEEAFRKDDLKKAKKVMLTHRRLKGELGTLIRRVAASELTADMAVVYSGAAAILRRISAHLSNIASSVVQPYDRIRTSKGAL